MAFKAILKTNNQTFDLVSYSNHFFCPHPNDMMFYRKENFFDEIKDPIALFGSYRKYQCWRYHLLDGFDPVESFGRSFYPTSSLKGGVFTFEIESDGVAEELFEYNISTDKPNKWEIPLFHGEILFYDDKNEFLPFMKMEFLDGFVCDLSETFSSTGAKPMLMQVSISPATIRYNDSVVFQQDWWITEIDRKEAMTEAEESETIRVKDVYWMEKDSDKKLYVDYPDYPVTLYIETNHFNEGDSVTIKIKSKDGEKLANGKNELIITESVNSDGIAIIENFKMN